MKYRISGKHRKESRSHPSRGAWIEIMEFMALRRKMSCRTPHGVRGLKSVACYANH